MKGRPSGAMRPREVWINRPQPLVAICSSAAARCNLPLRSEIAIIDSAPRLSSLVTRGDVRVLAIDGETFKGSLRERPEVSLAVLRSMSRRLRVTAG